jgi:hypothetical protein
MWPRTFAERLESWTQLRAQASVADVQTALAAINTWWFQTPWRAYHLHWDDQPSWPDPWQLLSDDIYCPLARGLGILYTITMLDRADLQDAVLAEVGSDNLVLVDKSKYILNWDSATVVNISPTGTKSRHSITQEQIKQQIG